MMKTKQIILLSLLLSMLILSACVTGQAKGGDNEKKFRTQCNDQIDNDGDGYCDWEGQRRCRDGSKPGDPDCFSKYDNNEGTDCKPNYECKSDEDCEQKEKHYCKENILVTQSYGTCEKTKCGTACQYNRPVTTTYECEGTCENGACVNVTNTTEPYSECLESEYNNPYIQETTYVYVYDENGNVITSETRIGNDRCYTDGSEDLSEFYCSGESPNHYISQRRIDCENGCENGVCVNETDYNSTCYNGIQDPWEEGVDCGGPCVQECVNQYNCYDTDGLNYYQKGNISFYNYTEMVVQIDYCIGNLTVKEYYCNGDYPAATNHNCNMSYCLNGACQ